MKRVGIIDLGTNSVRGFVFELESKSPPKLLSKYKEMVRLGEGVFTDGVIKPSVLTRTLEAFKVIAHLFAENEVQDLLAVGTSALRTATNRDVLIDSVRKATGIELTVLSEEDEAQYIGEGVMLGEPAISGTTLVVDIGGGSVEVVLYRTTKILSIASLEFGASAVLQRYLKGSPPDPGGTDSLRNELRDVLSTQSWGKAGQVERVFGSSGSARTLVRATNGPAATKMQSTDLRRFISNNGAASLEVIAKNPQIERRRVDLILGAAIVLDEILYFFRATEVTLTQYSLKDGLVRRFL